MNSLTVIFLAFAISAAYSSTVPLGLSTILQGPASRTIVAGPDGSVISAVDGAGVVSAAGLVSPVIQAAPIIARAAPVPIIARAAPVWGLGGNTVVAGPSGVISTNGLGLATVNGIW